MNYLIWLLLPGVLEVFAVSAKKSKCALENNVGRKDRVELSKNPYYPSEKILCYLKCEYERIGAFNFDKTVDADKVVEHLNSWRTLRESTKDGIRECVKKQTTEVNNCYNIEPYYHCVREGVQKEVRLEMGSMKKEYSLKRNFKTD